eukprot:s46_g39.t1
MSLKPPRSAPFAMLPGPFETWEMRAQKHPERLQNFLVAVAEQPNYFADVIDELRSEDFEDEKDKKIETSGLTRQQSAEPVLKCHGDMISL